MLEYRYKYKCKKGIDEEKYLYINIYKYFTANNYKDNYAYI